MKTILITGSTGMLGTALVQLFSKSDEYVVYGLSREPASVLPLSRQIHLDLSKPEQYEKLNIRADIIVHTAAITDLNLCELRPETAHVVHVESSAFLASSLKKNGRFFYISTDSVFDGNKGNYSETDEPNPLNIYAKTKLEGELAVRNTIDAATVIRTNIFGFHVPVKNSLAEWAYQSWVKHARISGFTDIVFNPVYIKQLSDTIKFMIEKDIHYPILNVGSNVAISKYNFLEALREALNIPAHLLGAAASTDFPSNVSRPKNTSLDTTSLSGFFEVPGINDGIRSLVADFRRLKL
jgi:dTDP-4-dehydrorhamnose reductase